MMAKVIRTAFNLILLVMMLALVGCSTLGSRLEQPTLKVTSIALGDGHALSQGFRIGLLVTNPNGVDLPVTGMHYTLSLNGQKILSGANNTIPTLVAYSETPVMIEATADILAVARLVRSLTLADEQVNYQLATKLGLSGWRLPVTIRQTGQLSLDSLGSR